MPGWDARDFKGLMAREGAYFPERQPDMRAARRFHFFELLDSRLHADHTE